VNKRLLLFLFFGFTLVLGFTSCKKINQSTTLGDDLVSGIDGVTTFDTTISVEAYNSIFTAANDSFNVFGNEEHLLGNISNDPFFGKTNAKIFMQFNPTEYPWVFSGITNKDSLFLDSVVMVLGWTGTYGDTLAMQRVKVYEMDPSNVFTLDSAYQGRQEYFTYSNLLGSRDFFPKDLRDSVKAFRDTTRHQMRIRLANSFGRRLLDYDSASVYKSDSAFNAKVRGFALEADPAMGNAIMSFGLMGNVNTKLAIYYRYQKGGRIDTTVDYFAYNGLSSHHNYINRNFAGTPLQAASNTPGADDYVYLDNVPGSYATIKIPGLKSLSNRVIHRAELIVEQVYDPSDQTFLQPYALYLDMYDTTLKKYKAVPYDLIPENSGTYLSNFGMYGVEESDNAGNRIKKWRFKLTRFIQNYITGKVESGDFRLLTHHTIFDQFSLENSKTYYPIQIPVNSFYGMGRVRVAGGNHPTQRMRLRIVYTKI
jgi:hypothetical protein